jgi:hypothetical protein
MQVMAIRKTDPSSMQGTSFVVALAADYEAARQWIAEETKKSGYAPGKSVDFWLDEYPVFSIIGMTVHQ